MTTLQKKLCAHFLKLAADQFQYNDYNDIDEKAIDILNEMSIEERISLVKEMITCDDASMMWVGLYSLPDYEFMSFFAKKLELEE